METNMGMLFLLILVAIFFLALGYGTARRYTDRKEQLVVALVMVLVFAPTIAFASRRPTSCSPS